MDEDPTNAELDAVEKAFHAFCEKKPHTGWFRHSYSSPLGIMIRAPVEEHEYWRGVVARFDKVRDPQTASVRFYINTPIHSSDYVFEAEPFRGGDCACKLS